MGRGHGTPVEAQAVMTARYLLNMVVSDYSPSNYRGEAQQYGFTHHPMIAVTIPKPPAILRRFPANCTPSGLESLPSP